MCIFPAVYSLTDFYHILVYIILRFLTLLYIHNKYTTVHTSQDWSDIANLYNSQLGHGKLEWCKSFRMEFDLQIV